MNFEVSSSQIKSMIVDKLSHNFGVSPENATDEQFYKSCALILRDMMIQRYGELRKKADQTGTKRVYYLCMEFLMGRSLRNTLFNLNLEDTFRTALEEMNIKLDNLFEQEPDAGLGNGGLGRLAACFLDGLASQGYSAMGYSLRYEYGIFRQKLVEGWQTELPDFWLPGGRVWLQEVPESSVTIRLDGHVEESWSNGFHTIEHKD